MIYKIYKINNKLTQHENNIKCLSQFLQFPYLLMEKLIINSD